MLKAWKNEVFSGPRPGFWGGTVTGTGAIEPDRAAAGTVKVMTKSRISFRSPLVKTK